MDAAALLPVSRFLLYIAHSQVKGNRFAVLNVYFELRILDIAAFEFGAVNVRDPRPAPTSKRVKFIKKPKPIVYYKYIYTHNRPNGWLLGLFSASGGDDEFRFRVALLNIVDRREAETAMTHQQINFLWYSVSCHVLPENPSKILSFTYNELQ